MIFKALPLSGAYLIEPERLADDRGFFARTFCRREFMEQGLKTDLVQCNISFNSRRGTLRGMHWQDFPAAEAKLVRCTAGALHDVIIDIRRDSPTFLAWTGVHLSAGNRAMLYAPEGFAHGFLTLSDDTEVFYQMSRDYSPEHARGARWNDPLFEIRWPEKIGHISEKDSAWPDFSPAIAQ